MILDTNALSAVADGDTRIEPFLREASEVAVPVIVLGEFRFGIRGSRGRTQYERWLLESMTSYRILRIEEQTSESYAEIRDELKRLGRPVPANNLWIAALTRQHALPLMSRDQHFDSVPGLRRIAW